jgi:hypothetical protein
VAVFSGERSTFPTTSYIFVKSRLFANMESLSTEKLINVFAYPLRTNSRLFTLTQQFKFKEKGKED